MNKLIKFGGLILAILIASCDDGESEESDLVVNIEKIQNGAEGGASLQFALNMVDGDGEAASSTSDVTITVVLSGDISANDIDGALDRVVIITAGQTLGNLEINPSDDDEEEGNEDVIASMTQISGATLGTVSATGRISDNDGSSSGELNVSDDISILIDQFYHTDEVTITFDDNWLTINTTNQPDHKSMYYPSDHELYEAYDEPNNSDFKKNPNEIGEQDITFKIPRNPSEASSKSATSLGPMGVAVNSVVFFNQEAAPGDDILDELNTFDQYEGHPAGDNYHYHLEPVWLTTHKSDADNEAFIGFLLDGFPIYGPYENGVPITNDDLDDYHGHVSVTPDFPNGIYHYHANQEYPWINGDGYFGEQGTVTR